MNDRTTHDSPRTHTEDVALAVSHQAARDGLDFITALHTLLTDVATDTATTQDEPPSTSQGSSTQTTLTTGAWAQPESARPSKASTATIYSPPRFPRRRPSNHPDGHPPH